MLNMHKPEIINILSQELKQNQEILFAYVFGSFVKGENYKDIDVAIYVNDLSKKRNIVWYPISISVELEKKINKSVDVVLLNKLPDHIIYEVSKGILLFSRAEDFRIDFLNYSWKKYFDIAQKRDNYIHDMG